MGLWVGNPFTNGTQIGSNVTMTLLPNQTKNISATYTVLIGDTVFYVLADIPLQTNGTVRERNESNNVANRTLTVSSWQYVLGYEQSKLKMYDPAYNSMFEWYVQNTSGGLVFATDVDSVVNWLNLTAISRTRAGAYSLIDFSNMDLVLTIENNSDSVNRTYTASGNPKKTENISVFNKMINYVPIVNSTNNSNFVTGILWDSSDGGVQYNGSQDLIFLTHVNMNATGYNSSVDFELRVPATLRQYKSGVDAVALYAELT